MALTGYVYYMIQLWRVHHQRLSGKYKVAQQDCYSEIRCKVKPSTSLLLLLASCKYTVTPEEIDKNINNRAGGHFGFMEGISPIFNE